MIAHWLECIANELCGIRHQLKRIADALNPPIVGIVVTTQEQENDMAQKMKLKKASRKAGSPRAGVAGTVVTEFNLVPGAAPNSYVVMGVNANGDQIDVASVATLAASSDAPTIVNATVTSGMTFNVTLGAPTPATGATANITLTATWNDGSIGPFSDTLKATVQAGGVIGIDVVTTA